MIRKILQSPDPRVRAVCEFVTDFSPSLKQLALEMIHTIHASSRPAYGLSANQMGDTRRLFVIDEGCGRGRPVGPCYAMVFVNPTIRKARGEQRGFEGCLSLPPEEKVMVTRAKIINWNAFDIEGNPISGKASDLFARIFQHELDHLDGKLITDLEKRS